MSEFNYTHDKSNFKIRVKTPYDKKFVEKARNLRGSWDSKVSEWVFDDSIEEYLKDALMDVYGTTGESPVELVNLLIKEYSGSGDCQPVELFGRTIARAFGRDSNAKLGDGIVWISGDYSSGGSVKNWRTYVDGTFEIQNFPVPRLKKEDVQLAITEGWCIVKESKRKRKKEDIETDIEKYKALLLELEAELNNL